MYCLHKLVRFKAPTLWSGLWPLMGLFRICVHCLCHTEQPEQLCAAVDVEFVVKAGGVHFYGGFGEAQLPRDLPPNFGGQQEYGYLLLPGRQAVLAKTIRLVDLFLQKLHKSHIFHR